ncbi:MAG: KpsF/GutQ family sugar-phosphate isomerase [Halobacteriovorax sp.]|nr:KpsF/GutQ family sugar-phosphate isomerase [Halobacteriovorax sp.]
MTDLDALKILKSVLTEEAQAITSMQERLTDQQAKNLVSLFREIRDQDAQLIFCGVGKSGHIGTKLSATFSSLGLRSQFLHPTEALHGDLGRVGPRDAIVVISKSGTTEEIIKLLPFLDIPREKRVGLLGNVKSPLAESVGIPLDCSVAKEACLNNQAPTTSTTVAMAMGDAMAVLFEACVGLSKEGFAVNHPGGWLGKQLRMKVKDIMRPLEQCPVANDNQILKDVILAMTKLPVGGCAILNQKKLVGIIVEGDIRRTFAKDSKGVDSPVKEVMTANPLLIKADSLAVEALEIMETKGKSIGVLPVVDAQGVFLGMVTLHDLVREGFTR